MTLIWLHERAMDKKNVKIVDKILIKIKHILSFFILMALNNELNLHYNSAKYELRLVEILSWLFL